MGWPAARELRESLANLRRVLAIELYAATRALELREPNQPGPAGSAVLKELRKTVPGVGDDRFTAPELAACEEFIRSGALARLIG